MTMNGYDPNRVPLAQIPAEYQELFRQAIQRELAEAGPELDDTAVLEYLRQRQKDMQYGSFIRPDGQPGVVEIDPHRFYDGPTLVALAQNEQAEPGRAVAARRQLLLKVGGLIVLAILGLFLALRGRAQREARVAAPATTPAATRLASPTIPPITGIEDALETIGGLGGALTLGRPSSLELHFGHTEEVVALPIDPSRTTPQGELRYNEVTMRSDRPVAVWLFGTVLNYVIGVPDSLVRNLEEGDRVVMQTDTGASLTFLVTTIGQGANYDVSRRLSQNRIGLTLFSLPAPAEEAVTYAYAVYDVTAEDTQTLPVYGVGDPVPLGRAATVQVEAVTYSHTANGAIRVVIKTIISGTPSTVNLTLTAGAEQTAAAPLEPLGEGEAEAPVYTGVLDLPMSAAGQPLVAEFRALPAGDLARVQLGDVPNLAGQLAIQWVAAAWEPTTQQVTATLTIHHPGRAGEGAVYLDPNFIQLTSEGSEALVTSQLQVMPNLPFVIGPGETKALTLAFRPQTPAVQLFVGPHRWAISGWPAEPPR